MTPLTPRQVEIVRLLARGYSNQQIADALVIEHGTVKNHLHNIYDRLGVRRRADAVRVAGELNII